MDLSNNNFGLSGQVEFDYFIFCGKRCKKRKAEKLKVRLEKKRLKNDERRAETERLRAETELMKKGFESPPQSAPTPDPKAAIVPQTNVPLGKVSRPPTPYYTPPVPSAPKPKKTGFGNMAILLIGLAAIGGLAFAVNRKKNTLTTASV